MGKIGLSVYGDGTCSNFEIPVSDELEKAIAMALKETFSLRDSIELRVGSVFFAAKYDASWDDSEED